MECVLAQCFSQASHYDAFSGIYIGPSRSLSDDEYLLAFLSVQEEERQRRQEVKSPLPVDPLSGEKQHE